MSQNYLVLSHRAAAPSGEKDITDIGAITLVSVGGRCGSKVWKKEKRKKIISSEMKERKKGGKTKPSQRGREAKKEANKEANKRLIGYMRFESE